MLNHVLCYSKSCQVLIFLLAHEQLCEMMHLLALHILKLVLLNFSGIHMILCLAYTFYVDWCNLVEIFLLLEEPCIFLESIKMLVLLCSYLLVIDFNLLLRWSRILWIRIYIVKYWYGKEIYCKLFVHSLLCDITVRESSCILHFVLYTEIIEQLPFFV